MLKFLDSACQLPVLLHAMQNAAEKALVMVAKSALYLLLLLACKRCMLDWGTVSISYRYVFPA